MGRSDSARIDTGLLLDVAGQYDAAADELAAAVRTQFARLSFGGAVAGRAHRGAGELVRRAIDALAAEVRAWSRSDAELASALRTSAESYRGAELRSEARLV